MHALWVDEQNTYCERDETAPYGLTGGRKGGQGLQGGLELHGA